MNSSSELQVLSVHTLSVNSSSTILDEVMLKKPLDGNDVYDHSIFFLLPKYSYIDVR